MQPVRRHDAAHGVLLHVLELRQQHRLRLSWAELSVERHPSVPVTSSDVQPPSLDVRPGVFIAPGLFLGNDAPVVLVGPGRYVYQRNVALLRRDVRYGCAPEQRTRDLARAELLLHLLERPFELLVVGVDLLLDRLLCPRQRLIELVFRARVTDHYQRRLPRFQKIP